MAYVLIQHNVAKYGVFEPIFKDDEERRRRGGSKSARLFRNIDNPNNLFALFEWDTVENARKFADSYELREAREWATDVSPPKAIVIEEILASEA